MILLVLDSDNETIFVMSAEQNKPTQPPAEGKQPPADTGNASNPSPTAGEPETVSSRQALDPKAETYLRESANIEDLPDALDQEEAEYELGGGD